VRQVSQQTLRGHYPILAGGQVGPPISQQLAQMTRFPVRRAGYVSQKPELAAMKPRVVDLFSGAGGLSLGFHAAGCHIQAAFDQDPVAARTFKRNFVTLQKKEPAVVFGT
jgi:hypothetical protein